MENMKDDKYYINKLLEDLRIIRRYNRRYIFR